MKCKYYKPYFKTLKKLIGEYYQLYNCGSGGPLHEYCGSCPMLCNELHEHMKEAEEEDD